MSKIFPPMGLVEVLVMENNFDCIILSHLNINVPNKVLRILSFVIFIFCGFNS